MPYYTRVLSQREQGPSYDELVDLLAAQHPGVVLSIEEGEAANWVSLLLSHADGDEIAVIDRNGAEADGQEALAELVEEVRECRPESAVAWLVSFLSSVRVIYAFQHLPGTERDGGDAALRAVSTAIWARGDAIMQADGEGFSNEDGYHILWQFSEKVAGPWWMAVLVNGQWVRFEMDLGRTDQREAFLEGRVPPGARLFTSR